MHSMANSLLTFSMLYSVRGSTNATTTASPAAALPADPSSSGRNWDVVVQTCDVPGAGTDAAAYLKLYYVHANAYETFLLDNPNRNDFERGARDHFKIRVRGADIAHLGVFWWPGFSLSQQWCVDWVTIMNSDLELCFIGFFNKWILHYRDPPTYPSLFVAARFEECVSPRNFTIK